MISELRALELQLDELKKKYGCLMEANRQLRDAFKTVERDVYNITAHSHSFEDDVKRLDIALRRFIGDSDTENEEVR